MGLPIPILDSLIEQGGKIIGKLVKDKDLAAKLEHEFRTFYTGKEFDTILGQLEINKVEAAHKSIFVAGWRPFVGWVCGVALAYSFIIYPTLMWVAWLIPEYQEAISNAPQLELGELMTVLLGMLGLTVARSYEKTKGVHSDSLKN